MDAPPIPLADDFSPPALADWRALVEASLKGADFERRLVSTTADGLRIEPLFTAADAPAPTPPLWGPGDRERPWDVRTIVAHPDPARANVQALQDLQGGAASVLLRLDPAGADGIAVGEAEDMAQVLEGVVTDLAPVALDAGFLGPDAAEWLSLAAGRGPAAPLAFNLDPLSTFARTGAGPGPVEAHISAAAAAGARLAETHPKAGLFLASGRVVHEAGGTEAQELGFALAAALAYARAAEGAGLPAEAALRGITLGLSTDGAYFVSLAKLRAARRLWARLTQACGADAPARIEARSSDRMLSTLDPWTNLVRLTCAGFAAAAGGADAVILAPFTTPMGAPTDFARRQARNAQLVLMEESGLGRVADPAAGSWFVETLTDGLARKAWAFLQEVEGRGGLAEALRRGFVADAVTAARAALEADVASRKAGLVGVSEYPALLDAPVEVEVVDAAPFAKRTPDLRRSSGPDDACPPLAPMRLSQPFEALRSRASAAPSRPEAYLALLGPAAEHAARAGFARNLLAAGGIAAEAGPADGYDAATTPLVVICGSDAAYAEQAAEAARALKARGARTVSLAGRPGEHEAAWRAAGVDGFLYAGASLPTALDALLEGFAA